MPEDVVIVGGGFAGLYAARKLRNAPVNLTLIDKHNYHLFQPLLYQVATGGLSPSDIASPLRRILRKQKNTRVVLGEMIGLDPDRHLVILENGSVRYDTLILSTGACTDYFGHGDWERVAPGLKSIEDATEIRKRILLAFEAAERESDPDERQAWLTFALIGAGPTGAELAGALGEIANRTLRDDFRHIRPEEARILLLDASDRVLPAYPGDLSLKAERQLIGLGVRPRTGLRVELIGDRGVTVRRPDGGAEFIASRTVIWAAGVRASSIGRLLKEQLGAELDRKGAVLVNPDLSVPGHPSVFVAGDLAHVEQDGAQIPGVAPAAIQMGHYLARLLKSRMRGKQVGPFHYRNKGSLATIGRHAAVADFGKLHFCGMPAWLAWLFVHIAYLIGYQNRILVLLQWAFKYVTFNPRARLITGTYAALPTVDWRSERGAGEDEKAVPGRGNR